MATSVDKPQPLDTGKSGAIRGRLAIALAVFAAVFVPALLPGKSMHTGDARPLTTAELTLAALLLAAPLTASFVAWHRRPLNDRACAVVCLLLTLWVLSRFLNWLS